MSVTVYTTHAFRWGDPEGHSYPVGVYSTEALARAAAEKERVERGFKYEFEIYRWEVDAPTDDPEVVLALPPRE